MRKYQQIFLIGFFGLLVGCVNQAPLVPGAFSTPMQLTQQLSSEGAQLVRLGDNVTIIIPSDKIFALGTSNLEDSGQSMLMEVAALIKSYGPPANIKVIGYTDDVGRFQQLVNLSRYQADAIVAFFWAHGIPFRQMQAIGRGPCCAIATNDTVPGSGLNRHIEISFRLN